MDSSATMPGTAQSDVQTSPTIKQQPLTDTTTDTSNTITKEEKVKIHFVPVGSAPILKRSKYQVYAHQRFVTIQLFLMKLLQLPTKSPTTNNSINNNTSSNHPNLFLYCHSAFVPSPDHLIGELRDSFAIRDELVIHYSIQEAWG